MRVSARAIYTTDRTGCPYLITAVWDDAGKLFFVTVTEIGPRGST